MHSLNVSCITFFCLVSYSLAKTKQLFFMIAGQPCVTSHSAGAYTGFLTGGLRRAGSSGGLGFCHISHKQPQGPTASDSASLEVLLQAGGEQKP